MKFLILSTDVETFETHIVPQFPVVGTEDKFVVPAECILDDQDLPIDLIIEDLAELGLVYHGLV